MNRPDIDNGVVAFSGNYGGHQRLFTSSGGQVTEIVRTGQAAPTGFFSGFLDPSISDVRVAFNAGFGNGQRGIFVGDGGPLTTLVRTAVSTPVGTFTSLGALSFSHDTAAFEGIFAGGRGIFTASETELSNVIKTGDSLFGSSVTVLGFERFGLDADGSGNIAFNYRLADGRQGVAAALVVPEPKSIGLGVAGVLMICIGMRRSASLADRVLRALLTLRLTRRDTICAVANNTILLTRQRRGWI